LVGYDGSFDFKEPGKQYEETPYVGMRCVSREEERLLFFCMCVCMHACVKLLRVFACAISLLRNSK